MTDLVIDLEKKEAKTVLPYFFLEVEDKTVASKIITDILSVPGVSIRSSGKRIDIDIEVDFGPMIPSRVWTMFGNYKMLGMNDAFENLQRQAILEAVKQILPRFLETLAEKVQAMKENFYNQKAQNDVRG